MSATCQPYAQMCITIAPYHCGFRLITPSLAILLIESPAQASYAGPAAIYRRSLQSTLHTYSKLKGEAEQPCKLPRWGWILDSRVGRNLNTKEQTWQLGAPQAVGLDGNAGWSAASKKQRRSWLSRLRSNWQLPALQLDGMGQNRFRCRVESLPTWRSDAGAEEARGKRGKVRSGRVRVFDKALLAAEIICALVVSWLVIQYIYTVYFDTTPHRLTATGPLIAKFAYPPCIRQQSFIRLRPLPHATYTVMSHPVGRRGAAGGDGDVQAGMAIRKRERI